MEKRPELRAGHRPATRITQHAAPRVYSPNLCQIVLTVPAELRVLQSLPGAPASSNFSPIALPTSNPTARIDAAPALYPARLTRIQPGIYAQQA